MSTTFVNAFTDELEKMAALKPPVWGRFMGAGSKPKSLLLRPTKPKLPAKPDMKAEADLARSQLRKEMAYEQRAYPGMDQALKTAAIRLSKKQIGGLVAAGISVPIIHQLITNPSTRPGSKQNKAVKAAIKKEHRDPRLYSNIRGGLTGESRKERVAAHKRLG